MTNSSLTVTYILYQGYKRIEAEYVSSQKLEAKKINKTPDSKKGNKKSEDWFAKQSRALRARKTTRNPKTRNAEVNELWLGHRRAAYILNHHLPSPSKWLCVLPQPLAVTRQFEQVQAIAHVHTHNTVPSSA